MSSGCPRLVVVLAVLSALGLTEGRAGPPVRPSSVPAGGLLSVAVTASCTAIDAARPSGSISCTLHNRSGSPVQVAGRYDGRTVVLVGQGEGHRAPMSYLDRSREREQPALVTVQPGASRVLFELPLGEVLVDRRAGVTADFEAGRRVLVWDWERHEAAPATPIHGSAPGSFARRASFWVRIQVDGEPVESDRITLPVISGPVRPPR